MTGEEGIRARIFLLGCSRSGTTVLQSRLASHSDAYSFPETGFFRQLGGNRFWAALGAMGMVRRKAIARAYARLVHVMPELADSIPARSGGGAARVIADFRSLLDDHVLAAGRHIWIEKTPKHYQYCAMIRRYLPDAWIIHVVRDGRDVVASIRDRATRYPDRFADQADPAYGVREWNRAVRMAWRQRDARRVRVLLFDDLLASPENSLRSLCNWMGIDFQSEMLEAGESPRITLAHETWKDAAQGAIRPPESKFEKVFDATEQDWVNRHLDWSTYRRLQEHLRG